MGKKKKETLQKTEDPPKPKTGSAAGRPEIPYSKEMAEHICLLIAITPEGLGPICQANKHIPKTTTIYTWLTQQKEFSDMYWGARRHQALALADKTLEIAALSGDAKLQIATIQWHVSRLLPKIFGDKEAETLELKKTVEQLSKEVEFLQQYEKDY